MEISSQFSSLLKNINPIASSISPDLLNIFGLGDNLSQIFLSFNQAKNSQNPVEGLVNFFTNLDSQLEGVSDPGMVQGWMQKFASMPQNIIDEVLSKIPEPTFLNRSFSDSIGSVAKVQNYRDDSVLPQVNASGAAQDLLDTGMKLPAYIEENLNEIGQITKQLLNKNLSGVVGQIPDPSSLLAHASNLVPDSLHLDRFAGIANDYIAQSTEVFGGASNFVKQLLNETPLGSTSIGAPIFDVIQKVEGLNVAINSAGQDIVNLPEKAISLLTTPVA